MLSSFWLVFLLLFPVSLWFLFFVLFPINDILVLILVIGTACTVTCNWVFLTVPCNSFFFTVQYNWYSTCYINIHSKCHQQYWEKNGKIVYHQRKFIEINQCAWKEDLLITNSMNILKFSCTCEYLKINALLVNQVIVLV